MEIPGNKLTIIGVKLVSEKRLPDKDIIPVNVLLPKSYVLSTSFLLYWTHSTSKLVNISDFAFFVFKRT